jgi:hypothetical protein
VSTAAALQVADTDFSLLEITDEQECKEGRIANFPRMPVKE